MWDFDFCSPATVTVFTHRRVVSHSVRRVKSVNPSCRGKSRRIRLLRFSDLGSSRIEWSDSSCFVSMFQVRVDDKCTQKLELVCKVMQVSKRSRCYCTVYTKIMLDHAIARSCFDGLDPNGEITKDHLSFEKPSRS